MKHIHLPVRWVALQPFDSAELARYLQRMRLTIHADDGYSASVVISNASTSLEVIESFCKLRLHTNPTASQIVDPADCVLAYEVDIAGDRILLESKAIVQDALLECREGSSHRSAGRLVVLGYKTQDHTNALSDIYGYTARMTMISAVLSRSLQYMDSDNADMAPESLLGDRVHSATEAYIAEIHRMLDAEPASEIIVAAKGSYTKLAISFSKCVI